MAHPFEVGGKYSNHFGEYEVLEIDEPKMTIRYADGREDSLTITLQTRIWENIRIEQESGVKPLQALTGGRSRKSPGKKGSSSSKRWGGQFRGLVDHDFQLGVKGTTWRRRTSLGGLLAQQLSDQTGSEFYSYTTYRRSQVFISLPDRHESKEWFPAAKLEFRLNETRAVYGFYIEKSDGPMDSTWDWPRLMIALAGDGSLFRTIEIAMRQLGLTWKMVVSDQQNKPGQVTCYEADPTSGLQRSDNAGQREKVSWDDFLSDLRTSPADSWCDLRLTQSMEKAKAIDLGPQLASRVVAVYKELLPLYKACLPTQFK